MQRNTSPTPFSPSPGVYDPDWWLSIARQSTPLTPSLGENLGQGNIGERIGDWARNSGFIDTRGTLPGLDIVRTF